MKAHEAVVSSSIIWPGLTSSLEVVKEAKISSLLVHKTLRTS